MSRRTSAVRWLLPAIIALLWLGLAGPLGSFSGKLGEVSENDSAAFLPDSAESTRVTELQAGSRTGPPPRVILGGEGGAGPRGGGALTEAAAGGGGAAAAADGAGARAGEPPPPIPSEDG